ncbi:MAG: nuclear transport factor 2 family protein [Candidatus Binatia bacterium]
MNSEQTAKIVNEWYSAMGQFDWDTVMSTLAEDVVFILAPKPYTKMIPYLGVWTGRDAFAEASRIRNETSTITGFALRDVVAQDNKAVALIYSKATCVATGKEFELDVIQWLELDDEGKITKCTAYFDPVPEMKAFTPEPSLTI